jgi:hypothetical protein
MFGTAHVSGRYGRAFAGYQLRVETLVAIAVGTTLFGFAVGYLSRPATTVSAYARGACVAMDMASAYGFLDDAKRKIVTRALTLQNNPYTVQMPGGYRALTTACTEIATQRWSAL